MIITEHAGERGPKKKGADEFETWCVFMCEWSEDSVLLCRNVLKCTCWCMCVCLRVVR